MGAVDAPFTIAKAQSDALLHIKLRRVARELIGLDVNVTAVAALRQYTGIDDVIVVDAADAKALASESRLDSPFDIIVCCDVIEHVDDAGKLLTALRSVCNNDTTFVLSTINALSVRNCLRAITGRESVHPDHVAYYSYGTLHELFRRHDFQIIEYCTFVYPFVNRYVEALLHPLYALAPSTADGILVIASPCESSW